MADAKGAAIVGSIIQLLIDAVIILWPLAWLGKKALEHEIKNDAKWQRREQAARAREQFGGNYKIK